MAVKVQVEYDVAKADEQLAQSQEKAAEGFAKVGAAINEHIQLDKVKDALDAVAEAAGIIGPAFGKTGEVIGKAVQDTVALGKAGVSVGAIFGPVGAIVGGIAGTIVGLFVSWINYEKQAEEAAAAHTQELLEQALAIAEINDETRDLVTGFKKFKETDLSSITAQLDAVDEKIAETIKLVSAGGKEVDAYTKRLALLRAVQSDNLEQARLAVITGVAEAVGKLNDAEDRTPKTLKELREESAEAKKKLEELRGEYTKFWDEVNVDSGTGAFISKETTDATIADFLRLGTELDKWSAKYDAAQSEVESREAAAREARAQGREEEQDAEDAADAYRRQREEEFNAARDEWRQEELDRLYDERQEKIRVAWKIAQQRIDAEREYHENAERLREERTAARVAEFQELQAQLEAMLAPVATVVGSVFSTITKNIESGNRAFAGMGVAFRAGVAEALKSLSKQWGAQALAATAAGFASLALGPIGGISATQHFTAAALYGAAAAAAGVGGAALAKGAGVASAPATAPGVGGNPNLGSPARGAAPGGTIVVNMVGNMFLDGDERTQALVGRKLGNTLRASNHDARLDRAA